MAGLYWKALPQIEWVGYRIIYERQKFICPNMGNTKPVASCWCWVVVRYQIKSELLQL